MSHTNHRQGNAESLSNCFVVLGIGCKDVEIPNSAEKFQRFLQLAARHEPVNAGNMKAGNIRTNGGIQKLIADLPNLEGGIVHAAFNSEEKLVAFLKDLHEADMGISIVVSGLFDQTRECCRNADMHPHTIEYSLGVFGKTEKLPDPSIMEVTTMCGHGQISFNAVSRMVKDVTRGVMTLDEATEALTKPCICGIVDPTRIRRLMEKLVAESLKPVLRNYIAMDPSKCDKCYACEVACVEAHPGNNGQAMCIVDASMGPAISLHCLHCASAPCMKACPTGNIVRDEEKDVVHMRGDRCIGCKLCASACPFGMIVWDQKQGQARKCDLCIERLEKGEDPACVAGCPTGALSPADAGEQMKRRRLLALQATMASLQATEEA
ncbi:MAG TPA: 4Fe-4S dicluster domain-containing protein [Chloroflexota bacterium]|nr:4Fe-4S dicluster domain-containing protein [Chloroflexota bacterium]